MRLQITIEGTTPLLCNRFTEEQALIATDRTGKKSNGGQTKTAQQLCTEALYLDTKGKPFIPTANIMRCIVEGGRFHKIGKAQVTTQKGTMMYACVEVDDVGATIIHKQPWKVDTRPIRNPSTGGRFLKHRPMFDDWLLKFEVILDEDMLAESMLRKIVDDAGRRIGLGDFRLDCKGPYGKFVVTHWTRKP
jgi:hypothetical protein